MLRNNFVGEETLLIVFKDDRSSRFEQHKLKFLSSYSTLLPSSSHHLLSTKCYSKQLTGLFNKQNTIRLDQMYSKHNVRWDCLSVISEERKKGCYASKFFYFEPGPVTTYPADGAQLHRAILASITQLHRLVTTNVNGYTSQSYYYSAHSCSFPAKRI